MRSYDTIIARLILASMIGLGIASFFLLFNLFPQYGQVLLLIEILIVVISLIATIMQINSLKQQMPELPSQKKKRFIKQYNLPPEDVEILISTKELASFYEDLTQTCRDFKMASNWVLSDILRVLKETKSEITTFSVTPNRLGQLLNLIVNKIISHTAAKTVFEELLVSTKDAETIVQEKGLAQVSDLTKIEPIINKIYQESAKQVEQYKQGKTQVLSYFIGQTMRATKGKANPGLVSELWKKKLKT